MRARIVMEITRFGKCSFWLSFLIFNNHLWYISIKITKFMLWSLQLSFLKKITMYIRACWDTMDLFKGVNSDFFGLLLSFITLAVKASFISKVQKRKIPANLWEIFQNFQISELGKIPSGDVCIRGKILRQISCSNYFEIMNIKRFP